MYVCLYVCMVCMYVCKRVFMCMDKSTEPIVHIMIRGMRGYREGSGYLAGCLDRRQVPIWFFSSTGAEDTRYPTYIHATHVHIRLHVHVI